MAQPLDAAGAWLATQEKLGKLTHAYRPGRLYLILGVTSTIVWLAVLPGLLSIFYSPLTLVVWLLLLLLIIATTRNHFRERSRRILLYEQGVIDVTPRGTQVARWDQVRYVWYQANISYAGTLGFAIHPTYTIQTIQGTLLWR